AFGSDAGEVRVLDDGLAVEDDGEAVALHGDLEAIPSADGRIGDFFRGHAGADFGGHLRIDAIAVHLARADRPAPHVHLALAATTEIDAAVTGFLDALGLLLAALIHRVVAIGEHDGQ